MDTESGLEMAPPMKCLFLQLLAVSSKSAWQTPHHPTDASHDFAFATLLYVLRRLHCCICLCRCHYHRIEGGHSTENRHDHGAIIAELRDDVQLSAHSKIGNEDNRRVMIVISTQGRSAMPKSILSRGAKIDIAPLGLIKSYGYGLTPSSSTNECNALAQMLCQLVRKARPHFAFTSIQVNKNYQSALHVDMSNLGPFESSAPLASTAPQEQVHVDPEDFTAQVACGARQVARTIRFRSHGGFCR